MNIAMVGLARGGPGLNGANLTRLLAGRGHELVGRAAAAESALGRATSPVT